MTVSGMQAGRNAYTSESRVATSPTLSLTTGVMGAKEGVLVMGPAAAGPWPFEVGTAIYTLRARRGGRAMNASLRSPARFYLSWAEWDACVPRGKGALNKSDGDG